MGQSDNTQSAHTKRKPPKTAWKKGQSGNPSGAPKRGESWAEIIKYVGDLTPSEAAEMSQQVAGKLRSIGDGVTLKQAVVLRVFAALMFEPQPGLLNAFMERTEGKVKDTIEHSGDEARPIVFKFIDETTSATERSIDQTASDAHNATGGE